MDCEHMVVELETDPVPGLSQLTYAHRFVCMVCKVSALYIERVVRV